MKSVLRILVPASAVALIGVTTVLVLQDEPVAETQTAPPLASANETVKDTTALAESVTPDSTDVMETKPDSTSIAPLVSNTPDPALSTAPASTPQQADPPPYPSLSDQAAATATDSGRAEQAGPALATDAQAASYQDQQQSAAQELSAATAAANPNFGIIGACFDQMRSFACPILGQIPVVRDVVGQVSLVLGISCPQGDVRPI
jgi:hypothetical protein